jgi:hypothetical protein
MCIIVTAKGGWMNTRISEKGLVKLVARVAPWLAPVPSAYFVGRSAAAHLTLPWPVAVVVALIIESLGLATVHTALWLNDWNAGRRKTDPVAPAWVALALGIVYLVSTIGLTVVLEVYPLLATYAPAIFPALAVVGAVNLALISQQERRELTVQVEREERKAARSGNRSGDRSVTGQVSGHGAASDLSAEVSLAKANAVRRSGKADAMDALVEYYRLNPGESYADAGRAVGRSKSWVVGAVGDLETSGTLRRNGNGVEVV